MKYIFVFLYILIFTGCTNSSPKVQEFFQTDNATHIQDDYRNIVKLLTKYKKKLDLRNPQTIFSLHVQRVSKLYKLSAS